MSCSDSKMATLGCVWTEWKHEGMHLGEWKWGVKNISPCLVAQVKPRMTANRNENSYGSHEKIFIPYPEWKLDEKAWEVLSSKTALHSSRFLLKVFLPLKTNLSLLTIVVWQNLLIRKSYNCFNNINHYKFLHTNFKI